MTSLPIAAISFDIDHTLLDFEAILENALAHVAEVIGAEFSVEVSAEELIEIGKQTFARYDANSTDFLTMRRQSLYDFLESRQLDTDFTDMLFDVFVDVRFRLPIFMPNAEELLESIPEGIKIAVLSNGNSDPERLGFAHYFDEILLGEDLPEKKPYTGAFSTLMEVLDISDPAEILHVGDSLHHDVKGAKDAGLKAVWYNPEKVEFDGPIRPDYAISDLRDLLPIIEDHL